MIRNLFSVFDPSSLFHLSLNWARTILIAFLVPFFYWPLPRKNFIIISSLFKKLRSEFKILIATNNSRATIVFISIFFFILGNNIIGLFPYIFTSTSHIALTLTLSLPLWVAFILFGWFNHIKHIFSHLVPQRTPGALIPFIVLIESIRNIIRPLTLAVRLIANIVAGHLLITLLGNQTAVSSNFILFSLILTQILLLTLESAVAFIQSYVFAVLSTLYSREVIAH